MAAIDNADFLFLVLALTIVFAASMFRLHASLKARLDELHARLDKQRSEFVSLQHLVREVHDEGVEARRREGELAEQVEMLGRQQEQLLIRDADSGPYFQAIRSARSGASAEALVSSYGLSQGEAELVVALHGSPAAEEPT